MNSTVNKLQSVDSTPAFVYDEARLARSVKHCRQLSHASGCAILYALKAMSVVACLESIAVDVDGFAVSSLHEAKLARAVIGNRGSLHITTPGFRSDEIGEIGELCDYVSFNSLSQWSRFSDGVSRLASCGLRINPQLSFIEDERYDPCRKHSKLGVPLNIISSMITNDRGCVKGISGIHFHSNCLSTDFSQLLRTVHHLDEHLREFLTSLSWINLGGGYLIEDTTSVSNFFEAVDFLKSRHGVEVFVEPGAAMVNKAGYLVTSVIDLFESEQKTVAILDTTVNHVPELFEYQDEPNVLGHVDHGPYNYILAGSSCLVGDLFGEYFFEEPLQIGSRVIFTEMGAYSFVKAHMFNGLNLPSIYLLTDNGELKMTKRFTYEDFASRCGMEAYATARARA